MRRFPLVSVITPSLNQGSFVEQTIMSVKDQDYPELEHIVIDGGSTDSTPEILKRNEHLIWVSEPDQGQADAVNKGFRLARGEILGWLNSDDIYVPGAVGKVVDYFLGHPHIDIVYGDCYEMNEEGGLVRTVKAHPVNLKRLLLLDFTLYQPTFFFRRRAVERIGPVNVGLHMGLDYDYIVRAAQTCVLGYLPQPIAAFRTHSESKTSHYPQDFLDDYLSTLNAVFSNVSLPASLARLRRRAYSNLYLSGGERSYAAGRVKEARERFIKALSLYPQPFRAKSIKAVLFLLDLVLGIKMGGKCVGLLGQIKGGLFAQRTS